MLEDASSRPLTPQTPPLCPTLKDNRLSVPARRSARAAAPWNISAPPGRGRLGPAMPDFRNSEPLHKRPQPPIPIIVVCAAHITALSHSLQDCWRPSCPPTPDFSSIQPAVQLDKCLFPSPQSGISRPTAWTRWRTNTALAKRSPNQQHIMHLPRRCGRPSGRLQYAITTTMLSAADASGSVPWASTLSCSVPSRTSSLSSKT